MKGKRSKRLSVFLGVLLFFVMVIGLLPTKALAEGGSSAAESVVAVAQEETGNQADKAEEGTETTAAQTITPTAAPMEDTEEPAAASATTKSPEDEKDKENQENSLDEASPKKAPASPAQNSGVKGNSDENPVTTTEEPAAAVSTGTSMLEKPAAPAWQVSKSKTAANLNKDFISDVTLSLPSAEEQLTTEVCFVLDKSSFSDTKEKAIELLNELKTAVGKTGAKVQVDIVEFNRTGHDHGSYDLATQYDEIEAAFAKQNSGGTNMEAGLLVAKEVLARNTEIPDSRKYMILVSDGDTYLHCKNGDYNTPYSRSYIPVGKAGGTAYGGYYDESYYYPSQPYKGNVGRPSSSDTSAWDAYLADVAARNNESNGDSYDFVWKYYDGWGSMTSEQIAADGFKTMRAAYRTASNIDIAYLDAANVYHELASSYHCYSVAVQSLNQHDGGHPAFMEYLNGGAAADFDSIKNEILYLVDSGSSVEDYMGYAEGDYNFDLVNPASMAVTLDNTADGTAETYQAVEIGKNEYGFGPVLDDGRYSYVVTYVPDSKDKEHLVWTINVPVTNFEHVSLNYTLKLVNPKTEPGTYGQYDANGSQNYDSLYTNGKAVLNPVDSKGQAGAPEEFAKPTVSYTVPATITYTDGVEKEEIFADQEYKAEIGQKTPLFEGTPARDGYIFKGWSPSVADTVAGNVQYTAVWKKKADNSTVNPTPTDSGKSASPAPTGSIKTASPAKTAVTAQSADTSPKTGDTSSLTLWMLLFAASAAGAIGICAHTRKMKKIK